MAKANTLLDQIGLRDANGDGRRDLPDGSPFSPELLTSSQFSAMTPQLVKEYLRAMGIDVRINSLDGRRPTRRPPGRPTSWRSSATEAWVVTPTSRSGSGSRRGVPARSFFNVLGYQNPQYEDLAARQSTILEPEQRKSVVQEIQRIVAEDVPSLPLYVPTRLLIFRKGGFDAWYFTPGGVWGAYPGPENKQAFVTGRTTGLERRGPG